MVTLAQLAARTAYYQSVHATQPNVPPGDLTRVTAVEATTTVREHFARDGRQRSVEAAPYGAVILRQAERSVRFEPWPDAMPKRLTARQADDLVLLGQSVQKPRLVFEAKGPIIHAGFTRIPPAATERLIEHGWVATDGRNDSAVGISLAGVVALTWRHCKSTNVPARLWAEAIAEDVHNVFCD
ncbi:hypothetical protein AB0M58_13175 [Streptomyces bobili]|uniref:hypothetical protein n=1 Tax=Streptomyces bobili TaxID=67280 RepID=UPI003434D095